MKMKDVSSLKNIYLEEVLQDTTETRSHPIDFRITGFWRWKRVIVPPNVYVIHTRQGFKEPVNIGVGISFRYNPYRDSFLLVPAAMQTIMINARCICAERQGILVQAYVQWIIDDVETAYRKLNFSDPYDPMRIVNEQLREQAEAAIKDKVTTMEIDEVLSDKQSIMEELTLRLREVVEGKESGLGLKIVTVQIKEAVVSSTRLWKNLQKPFRAQKEETARLAEIASEKTIRAQETANQKEAELLALETKREIDTRRQTYESESFDSRVREDLRRHEVEQENERKRLSIIAETERKQLEEVHQTELLKREKEVAYQLRAAEFLIEELQAKSEELAKQAEFDALAGELEKQALTRQIERDALRDKAAYQSEQLELELLRLRREIESVVSAGQLQERLLESLPDLVGQLPSPENLQRVHISSDGALPDSMASVIGLVSGLRNVLRSVQDVQPVSHENPSEDTASFDDVVGQPSDESAEE